MREEYYMKKFKLLLCLTLVVVLMSVGVAAFGSETDTATTYVAPYIGEYTAQDGSGNTGLAHIIFGKVSNTQAECGILLTDLNEGWTKKFEVKTDSNGKKRIASNGEFGIALYNLPDGEYSVCVYSGSGDNPITGDSFTIRTGVASYTITYVYESTDGTLTETESVAAGNTPKGEVSFTRAGYKLAGWKTSDGVVYDMNTPIYDDVTLYPVWAIDGTTRLTLSGNPSYITHETSTNSNEIVTLEFDVVEILNLSTIGTDTRIGFGIIDGASTKSGFVSSISKNILSGSGTLIGTHTTKSDYVGSLTTLTDIPLFKSGERVKVEYKPYVSASEKGYLKAYVKTIGSDDESYVLVGGVENITTKVGTLAMTVDRGTALDMMVANMSFSTKSGDLGIKNVAYAYESNGLYTKLSRLTVDDDISYEYYTTTESTVIVGSKTRLDIAYGEEYVMEFKVDYSNYGDYVAGSVNRQTGNVGIGLTSEDRVGWSSSPMSTPNSIALWYNNTGWRVQARLVDGENTAHLEDFSQDNELFSLKYPQPEAFKELYKTGNAVKVVYKPYFSAEETGGEEELGSFIIYVKKAGATDYSVWSSITDIPQNLSPRDNIGMYLWSDERGQGRKLIISDFTTRVGDHYVYSASGNTTAESIKVTSGGGYYAHSLSIDKTTLNLLKGKTETITATIEPDDEIIWASSDESVASVVDGVVTAIGEGTAIVTATAPGGKSVKCTVNVAEELEITLMLEGEVYDTLYATSDNGYKLSELPILDDITTYSEDSYYFGGWYLDSACTNKATLDTAYTWHTTLYADLRCAYIYDVYVNDVVIRGLIDEVKGIGELVIPDMIEDKVVTEIGYEAFKGLDLIEVGIPSTITKIGAGAFRDNVELSKVDIKGANLLVVGNSAFRGCESLTSATSIVLPNSIEIVGELAFYGANHPFYTKMYSLNQQRNSYYTPKYVWEFLGSDVMPIGSYGAITSKGNTGVADPTYGVGLEQSIKDFTDAGFNLMEFNAYNNAVQDYNASTQNSVGQYLKFFEDYGAMMLYVDSSMKSYTYEEYQANPSVNLTAVHYKQYLYNKFASFGGVLAEDEPGWVDWIDEFEESYSFYQRDNKSDTSALSVDDNGNYITITKSKKGRMDDGNKYWKENFPNKLMFVNLLQTYAPKWALPNGFYGYNDGGQMSGVPSFTGRWAPLDGELDYEYYYRTYIESVKPEVFSYDYYPLADGGTNLKRTHFEQLNYANYYSGDYYKEYHGTDTGIPFWPMIQLTGWNGYRPSTGANLQEVNWQINTALAYGAKGFSYYSYVSFGSTGSAIDQYGNKLDNYYVAQTANSYAQAMAKWLLNAEVDHLTQVGQNPNCYDWDANKNVEPEATPTRMLTPKDTSMNWSMTSSSGVPHLVSHMKYYANNNDYREGVAGDVRELYFACNNTITTDGNITLNFGKKVSGSYIYRGVERSFSGTSLTINVGAGEAFAILLDK